MSIRTIFEFNHDLTDRIRDDSDDFIRVFVRYLGSADNETAALLKEYGVTRIWWGHHSDERKLVTKHLGVIEIG